MKLKEISDNVEFISADVSVHEDCVNLVEHTVERFGTVDVLFNCAGILGELVPTLDTDMNNSRNVFDIDCFGTLDMLLLAGNVMKRNGGGVIINTSSINSGLAGASAIAYAGAKAAVDAFTRHAAKDVGKFGIRVVSVAPGWVRTEINRETLANNPELEKCAASMHMTNRILEPSEIAEVVYFLASDAASAINGSTVMCDDGYNSFKEGYVKLISD